MRLVAWPALLLLAGCTSASLPATVEGLSANQAAVTDGMRVTGTGRVVAVPDRPMRFCTPSADLTAFPAGSGPASLSCDAGVDVVGVDLTALDDARADDGATEGTATLTGTYTAGVLTVEQQALPEAVPDSAEPASPCPEPAGGWPDQGQNVRLPPALDRAVADYFQLHPSAAAFSRLLRPTDTTVVASFVVQDDAERAQVERELRPTLGDALCVVDARWSQAELEAAQQDPDLQVKTFGSDGLVVQTGTGAGNGEATDLQPHYVMSPLLVTPELRAAADRHPAGLVVFEPVLRPA